MRIATKRRAAACMAACVAAVLGLAACSDMGWNSRGNSASGSSGTPGWNSSTGMNSGGSAATGDETMGTRSTTPEANAPTRP